MPKIAQTFFLAKFYRIKTQYLRGFKPFLYIKNLSAKAKNHLKKCCVYTKSVVCGNGVKYQAKKGAVFYGKKGENLLIFSALKTINGRYIKKLYY